MSTGLERIATVIRVLGWVWLVVAIASVWGHPMWEHIGSALFGVGLTGGGPLLAAYGLAWIIDGFARQKPLERKN